MMNYMPPEVKSALGENNPRYAALMNNLAGLYRAMGQYEKAEALFLQAKNLQWVLDLDNLVDLIVAK